MVSDRHTGITDATLAGSDRMTGYTAINPRECGAGCGVRTAGRASGIGVVAVSWALAQAASVAVGACILAGGPSAFAKRKTRS